MNSKVRMNRRQTIRHGTLWIAVGLLWLAVRPVAAAQTVALAPGEIKALDRIHMTLTIVHPKSGDETVVHITSHTRLFVNRKYATTRDLRPGDLVIGTARRNEQGELEAIRLYVETRERKPEKPQEKAPKGS